MKRRSFLALTGVGVTSISGCTGLIGSSKSPSTSSTTTPRSPNETTTPETETPKGQPPRYASIIDLETAPLTYALTPTTLHSDDGAKVRMRFSKTATASHPATLVVTLQNANDFENTFRIGDQPLIGSLTSRNPHQFGEYSGDLTYRASLVLAPTANHDLVDTAPSVSRDSDGFWRADDVTQWLPDTVRLKPEETVRCEYAVVGHPDGVGKGRPTGVYEFRSGDSTDVQLAVWRTNHPGPEDESRFAGTPLPSLPRSSTAWYHDADATTPIFVRPGTERGSLPERIEFTVINRSRKIARCGHWSLYKLVGGEWYHIGPHVQTADCRGLLPGRSKTWTLNAYPGEALRAFGGRDGNNYGYLGDGRYAVVVGYGHEADQSAALVELVGDPVTVVPTDDVTASRSGDTLTVRSPKYDDETHPPSATLTVTRADTGDRTLIPEQVMRRRFRGLRNTLAFFDDDTTTVVLQTDERVAEQVVGYESDAQRFHFDGQAYEVRIEREKN